MSVLTVENLSKSFSGKKVLDNVSFTIEEGKIVGLMGKNGSGKTTVLKSINDLLTIDSGRITVDGEPIGTKTKQIVSYLPERTYLDSSETVKQLLDFFSTFYSDFCRETAEKLLADLGLDVNARLCKMSKGMKEKVQLILVMSRKARLYVLDEPLGGIDPVTRDYILKTILSNFNENASMLITTHLIFDVEKILDQVIFIEDGKIILDEDADALRMREGSSIDEVFRRLVK